MMLWSRGLTSVIQPSLYGPSLNSMKGSEYFNNEHLHLTLAEAQRSQV